MPEKKKSAGENLTEEEIKFENQQLESALYFKNVVDKFEQELLGARAIFDAEEQNAMNEFNRIVSCVEWPKSTFDFPSDFIGMFSGFRNIQKLHQDPIVNEYLSDPERFLESFDWNDT